VRVTGDPVKNGPRLLRSGQVTDTKRGIMNVTSERIRASRLSDRLGAALVALGVIGVLSAALLTAWVVHDIGKTGSPGPFDTISRIQAVALVGITPGMLSLLVVGFGVYLQTRSMELLLGVAVDTDLFADEYEDEDLPEPE